LSRRVALTAYPILISGETETGKGPIARAVHKVEENLDQLLRESLSLLGPSEMLTISHASSVVVDKTSTLGYGNGHRRHAELALEVLHPPPMESTGLLRNQAREEVLLGNLYKFL